MNYDVDLNFFLKEKSIKQLAKYLTPISHYFLLACILFLPIRLFIIALRQYNSTCNVYMSRVWFLWLNFFLDYSIGFV